MTFVDGPDGASNSQFPGSSPEILWRYSGARLSACRQVWLRLLGNLWGHETFLANVPALHIPFSASHVPGQLSLLYFRNLQNS
jgi:hypothetical protein